MNSDVLVIFENKEIYPGALTYAREFALRIDARVTLLMLVSMSFVGSDLLGAKRNALKKVEIESGRLLSECSQPFIQSGLELSSVLKIGDPAQELLKFLANRPPFKAILWGSSQKLPFSDKKGSGHWLKRVAVSLECPLLNIKERSK